MLHVVPAGILSFPSGYTIERALFFDGAADFLSKRFSAAGTEETWACSFWTKGFKVNTTQYIFSSRIDGSNTGYIELLSGSGNQLQMRDYDESARHQAKTNAILRDQTAWYHFLCVNDTTNGTSADNQRIYINGIRQGIASLSPSVSADDYASVVGINSANNHYIGQDGNNANWFSGYLAEFIFIDGSTTTTTVDSNSKLTSNELGEFDSKGVWVPKKPAVTFGTNGFHLKFNEPKNLGLDSKASSTFEESSISFLHHFAGDDGDTHTAADASTRAAKDSSSRNHSMTYFGNAQIDTAQSKFSGSSVLFDGAGDGITVNNASDAFKFPSDFTIEMWVRFPAINTSSGQAGANSQLITNRTDGSNYWSLQWEWLSSIGVRFVIVSGGSVTANMQQGSNSGWSLNTWYHVAVVRKAGTVNIYRDGTSIASSTAFAGISVGGYNDVTLGNYTSSTSGDGSFYGHMDELRISKRAVYEANFTAPSAAFSDPPAGNHFTVTSMGTNNVVVDSCTDDTTAEVTLFPCLDPNSKESSLVLSSNNLKAENDSASSWQSVLGSIGLSSGRFYYEITRAYTGHGYDTWGVAGDYPQDASFNRGDASTITFDTTSSSIRKYVESTSASSYYASGTGSATGDVIGVDIDVDNNTIELIVGGTERGTVDISGLAKPLFPISMIYTGGNVDHVYNFGSSSYTHTKPSGASNITSTVTGVGNFCTWNFLDPFPSAKAQLSNGNRTATMDADSAIRGTHYFDVTDSTGYYWETTFTANVGNASHVGISISSVPPLNNTSYRDTGVATYLSDGGSEGTWSGGLGTTGNRASGGTHATYAAGDTIGVAVKGGAIWFSKNGSWIDGANGGASSATVLSEINSGTTTNSFFHTITGFFTPMIREHNGTNTTSTTNWGQKAFLYTPPTNMKKLATFGYPAPTVTKPSDFFKAIIYEGTGAELSTGDTGVEALDFKPDFVWIKNRDTTDAHMLYDSVREATKDLHPSTADQESTTAETLKSFDANGFTLGTDVQVNTDNENYVAWCLKAGGAPTTDNDNTSGAMDDGSVFKGGVVQSSYTPSGSPSNYPKKMSIASHGGFSIIEYTGTGANATVPHGLDRTPDHIMLKPLTQNHSWAGYHSAMGTGSGNDKVNRWDGTTIGDQLGTAWQNNPFQTEHVITFGSQTGQNQDTTPHIMYVWAKTPGLIGIGSYVGNGADDGPYVVVDDGASGFRPAFVYTKRIDANSGDWWISDSARTPFNTMSKAIYIDNQAEEDANDNRIDFTANGFKLRDDSARRNTGVSGSLYMYLAFADDPFGGDGVAQAKAR